MCFQLSEPTVWLASAEFCLMMHVLDGSQCRVTISPGISVLKWQWAYLITLNFLVQLHRF